MFYLAQGFKSEPMHCSSSAAVHVVTKCQNYLAKKESIHYNVCLCIQRVVGLRMQTSKIFLSRALRNTDREAERTASICCKRNE